MHTEEEKQMCPETIAPWLQARLPLRMHNGQFRFLMVSDIQETADMDPRTLPALHALIAAAKPDLVLLGGDNLDGRKLKDEAGIRDYLNRVTAPMEERGIPWAHIYGNHDYDADFKPALQQAVYEQYPHCISRSVPGIPGVSNFLLPIHDEAGEVSFHIWALDSGNRAEHTFLPQNAASPLHLYPNPMAGQHKFDLIHFAQQMWYWQTSLALETYYGRRVPGMLMMHVAPWEFAAAVRNPTQSHLSGAAGEKLSLGALNSGIFATVLQRGDVGCIACAHTHSNDFTAEYCGITCCLDACAGYAPSGRDELRGGRLFCWDGVKLTSKMLRYDEVMA